MVSFISYEYVNVPPEELEGFIERAEYCFPGVSWEASQADMSVTTKRLREACKRLDSTQPITFRINHVWDMHAFFHLIPECEFPQPIAADLILLADQMVKHYHDSPVEVACFTSLMNFPWDRVPELLATMNSLMPLHGFIYDAESHRLWIRKHKSNHLMYVDPKGMYTNCMPTVVFDMDEGFMFDHENETPPYFRRVFEEWCKAGKRGRMLF